MDVDPAALARAAVTQAEFAGLLTPLGPWPRGRRVAVAVSGGADSLCLAWLSGSWGAPQAIIVDHALRNESAEEAARTAGTLAGFGVPSHTIRLRGLQSGPGLAARARAARYAALTEVAASLGITDLLLGHHARDQAETLLMREAAGSGAAGRAGMAVITERAGLRLVRPLLGIAPGRLRATLRAAGIPWTEDPSNTDPAALRPRLRAALDDPAGDGPRIRVLTARAAEAAEARAGAEARIRAVLAERAGIFPEGYALLSPGPIAPDCLAALVRALGGRPYAAAGAALRRLAADPGAGTLGGVRFMPAGRLGAGTLLVREASAMAPPVSAEESAVWDGRFVLSAGAALPDRAWVAGLGPRAVRCRALSPLPAAILRTLPALMVGDTIVAVPHLTGFRAAAPFTEWTNIGLKLTFSPPMPVAGAAWLGDAQSTRTHHVRLQTAGLCAAGPADQGLISG